LRDEQQVFVCQTELFLVTDAKPAHHGGPKIGGSARVASAIEGPERPSDPSIVQHGIQKNQATGRVEHTLHLAEGRVQLAVGQMVRHVDADDDTD
jgi:hypothetical protein